MNAYLNMCANVFIVHDKFVELLAATLTHTRHDSFVFMLSNFDPTIVQCSNSGLSQWRFFCWYFDGKIDQIVCGQLKQFDLFFHRWLDLMSWYWLWLGKQNEWYLNDDNNRNTVAQQSNLRQINSKHSQNVLHISIKINMLVWYVKYQIWTLRNVKNMSFKKFNSLN